MVIFHAKSKKLLHLSYVFFKQYSYLGKSRQQTTPGRIRPEIITMMVVTSKDLQNTVFILLILPGI